MYVYIACVGFFCLPNIQRVSRLLKQQKYRNVCLYLFITIFYPNHTLTYWSIHARANVKAPRSLHYSVYFNSAFQKNWLLNMHFEYFGEQWFHAHARVLARNTTMPELLLHQVLNGMFIIFIVLRLEERCVYDAYPNLWLKSSRTNELYIRNTCEQLFSEENIVPVAFSRHF